jgi:hypothetical protein
MYLKTKRGKINYLNPIIVNISDIGFQPVIVKNGHFKLQ